MRRPENHRLLVAAGFRQRPDTEKGHLVFEHQDGRVVRVHRGTKRNPQEDVRVRKLLLHAQRAGKGEV